MIRLTLLLIAISSSAFAQMDMNGMNMDSMQMPMDTSEMKMTSGYSLNLQMNRDGSGTSWSPDADPMAMYMIMKPKTQLMFHGNIFLRYTSQDVFDGGTRGDDQFDAPNWAMFMLAHQVGKSGLFNFTAHISLDPITEGGNGYPLLFQSGESYNGKALVDRQHPHDLFSGLSVAYTQALNENVDVTAYFGYPGEPALGPTVFMHRLSAGNNPDAPIGHHWQDATHITFGVASVGIRYKIFKLEGSIFNGREPDEDRYNFDPIKFNSYSGRISVNPNSNFSLQVSSGLIKSPEALEPDIDITRSTASVMHTKTFKGGMFIASTAVFGWNHLSNGLNENSFLLESNLKLIPFTIYSRYEFVQKDADELQIPFEGSVAPIYDINAITLGINRVLFSKFKTDLSIGVQGTRYFPDSDLKSIYGSMPAAVEVYLRIAPSLRHNHHSK